MRLGGPPTKAISGQTTVPTASWLHDASNRSINRCRAVTGAGPIVCCTENGRSQRGKTTIHRLIEEQNVLLVPGCYDALSAKILQSTGHVAGFISGYAVSATLLGEPDVGLLTAPEMARKAGQIHNCTPSLPILVDADTGGGNVLNVQRTVRQLISSGCKGCFLEDQEWPKRAGHMRGKEVISMEEFAAKIYAARQAVGDTDFFLVARTDARATSAKYGLDEAITRANLYMEAGADASFIEAPRSRYELTEIGKRTKGIRVCNMLEGGLTPMKTPAEMGDLGFHIVLYPLTGLYAATKALIDVYTSLATDGTTREQLDKMVSYKEFNELVGLEAMIALEESLTVNRSPDEKIRVRVKAPTKPHPTDKTV